jgi:MFS family permease
VSAACLLALSLPKAVQRAESQDFLRDLREGWEELVSHTWLWAIIVWAGTYLFFVVAPFFVLGPAIAKDELGGPTAWAAISTAWGIGAVAGGALALRLRPQRPMLVCCLVVYWMVVPMTLLAFAAPVPLIAAAQLVGGAGMGMFMALWTTTLQQHVPPDKLSRVSAYDWMGSLGLLPLGYVLAGPVAGLIGVRETLLVSVAWIVVSTTAVLLVRDVRELRRLDAEPVPTGEPVLPTA